MPLRPALNSFMQLELQTISKMPNVDTVDAAIHITETVSGRDDGVLRNLEDITLHDGHIGKTVKVQPPRVDYFRLQVYER